MTTKHVKVPRMLQLALESQISLLLLLLILSLPLIVLLVLEEPDDDDDVGEETIYRSDAK